MVRNSVSPSQSSPLVSQARNTARIKSVRTFGFSCRITKNNNSVTEFSGWGSVTALHLFVWLLSSPYVVNLGVTRTSIFSFSWWGSSLNNLDPRPFWITALPATAKFDSHGVLVVHLDRGRTCKQLYIYIYLYFIYIYIYYIFNAGYIMGITMRSIILSRHKNSTPRYDTLSAPGGVVGAARTGVDSSQLSEPAAARCPDFAAWMNINLH